MRALQLRRKNVPDAERAAQARALALCRELGVVFLINDDWKLALDVGADGAHVGRDDDSLARIRAEAGPDLILGGSSYDDLDRARELLDAGADYIAFGAMFASTVKPDTVRAPLSVLTEARKLVETFDGPGPPWSPSAASRRQRAPGGPGRRRLDRRHHALFAAPSVRRRGRLRRALFHQPQIQALTAMSSNAQLFERACRSIPGGVNSPVRAFRSVARRASSSARKAPTSGTPRTSSTSTTWAGVRPSWATRIPRSCARCRKPPSTACRSALPPRPRSSWPKR